MSYPIKVVSKNGLIYEGQVNSVSLPSTDGEIQILTNHEPILALLGPGSMRLETGKEEQEYAIGGGFVEVRPDGVTVLTDVAQRPQKLDRKELEASKEAAEKLLVDQENLTDEEVAEAKAILANSLGGLAVLRRKLRKKGQ